MNTPTSRLSSSTPWSRSPTERTPAGQAIRFLFEPEGKISDLKSWKIFQASMLQRQPEVYAEAIEAMKSRLEEIYTYTQSDAYDAKYAEQLKIYAGNLLALLPYFEPAKGSVITLPRYDGAGQWESVAYEVDYLFLNKRWGSPSISYLLTPQDDSHGAKHPPIIIFMGTAPPTTMGAAVSLWSDFCPGCMVGEKLYAMARDDLSRWVKDKPHVEAYGQSLGGALAQQFVAHHPDKVVAHVYNAPRLNRRLYDLATRNIQSVSTHDTVTRVYRYQNVGDWVSLVDHYCVPGTRSIEITPERIENPLSAHARAYSAHPHMSMQESDGSIQSTKQLWLHRIMTLIHQVMAMILFVPLTLNLIVSTLTTRYFKTAAAHGYTPQPLAPYFFAWRRSPAEGAA